MGVRKHREPSGRRIWRAGKRPWQEHWWQEYFEDRKMPSFARICFEAGRGGAKEELEGADGCQPTQSLNRLSRDIARQKSGGRKLPPELRKPRKSVKTDGLTLAQQKGSKMRRLSLSVEFRFRPTVLDTTTINGGKLDRSSTKDSSS